MGNTIVQLREPFSSGPMVAEENPAETMSAINKLAQKNAPAAPAQIRPARRSPAYRRVTIAPDVRLGAGWDVCIGLQGDLSLKKGSRRLRETRGMSKIGSGIFSVKLRAR